MQLALLLCTAVYWAQNIRIIFQNNPELQAVGEENLRPVGYNKWTTYKQESGGEKMATYHAITIEVNDVRLSELLMQIKSLDTGLVLGKEKIDFLLMISQMLFGNCLLLLELCAQQKLPIPLMNIDMDQNGILPNQGAITDLSGPLLKLFGINAGVLQSSQQATEGSILSVPLPPPRKPSVIKWLQTMNLAPRPIPTPSSSLLINIQKQTESIPPPLPPSQIYVPRPQPLIQQIQPPLMMIPSLPPSPNFQVHPQSPPLTSLSLSLQPSIKIFQVPPRPLPPQIFLPPPPPPWPQVINVPPPQFTAVTPPTISTIKVTIPPQIKFKPLFPKPRPLINVQPTIYYPPPIPFLPVPHYNQWNGALHLRPLPKLQPQPLPLIHRPLPMPLIQYLPIYKQAPIPQLLPQMYPVPQPRPQIINTIRPVKPAPIIQVTTPPPQQSIDVHITTTPKPLLAVKPATPTFIKWQPQPIPIPIIQPIPQFYPQIPIPRPPQPKQIIISVTVPPVPRPTEQFVHVTPPLKPIQWITTPKPFIPIIQQRPIWEMYTQRPLPLPKPSVHIIPVPLPQQPKIYYPKPQAIPTPIPQFIPVPPPLHPSIVISTTQKPIPPPVPLIPQPKIEWQWIQPRPVLQVQKQVVITTLRPPPQNVIPPRRPFIIHWQMPVIKPAPILPPRPLPITPSTPIYYPRPAPLPLRPIKWIQPMPQPMHVIYPVPIRRPITITQPLPQPISQHVPQPIPHPWIVVKPLPRPVPQPIPRPWIAVQQLPQPIPRPAPRPWIVVQPLPQPIPQPVSQPIPRPWIEVQPLPRPIPQPVQHPWIVIQPTPRPIPIIKPITVYSTPFLPPRPKPVPVFRPLPVVQPVPIQFPQPMPIMRPQTIPMPLPTPRPQIIIKPIPIPRPQPVLITRPRPIVIPAPHPLPIPSHQPYNFPKHRPTPLPWTRPAPQTKDINIFVTTVKPVQPIIVTTPAPPTEVVVTLQTVPVHPLPPAQITVEHSHKLPHKKPLLWQNEVIPPKVVSINHFRPNFHPPTFINTTPQPITLPHMSELRPHPPIVDMSYPQLMPIPYPQRPLPMPIPYPQKPLHINWAHRPQFVQPPQQISMPQPNQEIIPQPIYPQVPLIKSKPGGPIHLETQWNINTAPSPAIIPVPGNNGPDQMPTFFIPGAPKQAAIISETPAPMMYPIMPTPEHLSATFVSTESPLATGSVELPQKETHNHKPGEDCTLIQHKESPKYIIIQDNKFKLNPVLVSADLFYYIIGNTDDLNPLKYYTPVTYPVTVSPGVTKLKTLVYYILPLQIKDLLHPGTLKIQNFLYIPLNPQINFFSIEKGDILAPLDNNIDVQLVLQNLVKVVNHKQSTSSPNWPQIIMGTQRGPAAFGPAIFGGAPQTLGSYTPGSFSYTPIDMEKTVSPGTGQYWISPETSQTLGTELSYPYQTSQSEVNTLNQPDQAKLNVIHLLLRKKQSDENIPTFDGGSPVSASPTSNEDGHWKFNTGVEHEENHDSTNDAAQSDDVAAIQSDPSGGTQQTDVKQVSDEPSDNEHSDTSNAVISDTLESQNDDNAQTQSEGSEGETANDAAAPSEQTKSDDLLG